MFRFSIRGLAVYVAFVALTLALTRVEFVLGGVLLGVAVVIANFLVPIRVWRYVTYGAVLGIITAIVLLAVYVTWRFGNSGSRSFRPGANRFIDGARSYAFQFGALVGGTVGLIVCQARTRK